MESSDVNPFADPFQFEDISISKPSDKPPLHVSDHHNPFGEASKSSSVDAISTRNQPSVSQDNFTPSVTILPQAVVGRDELQRVQDEIERKAKDLERKEQQINSLNYNPRRNNWPPLPQFCPFGSCFFQDFSVDIPSEFQLTVKLVYYLWIFYVFICFNNVIECLTIFISELGSGTLFGLSVLWFVVLPVASLSWYRSVYNAFAGNSSFYFFLFFFFIFFQVCWLKFVECIYNTIVLDMTAFPITSYYGCFILMFHSLFCA